MKKKGFSTPSIFGGMNHYDEHGKNIGYSSPRLFGGVNHYDADGIYDGEGTYADEFELFTERPDQDMPGEREVLRTAFDKVAGGNEA